MTATTILSVATVDERFQTRDAAAVLNVTTTWSGFKIPVTGPVAGQPPRCSLAARLGGVFDDRTRHGGPDYPSLRIVGR